MAIRLGPRRRGRLRAQPERIVARYPGHEHAVQMRRGAGAVDLGGALEYALRLERAQVAPDLPLVLGHPGSQYRDTLADAPAAIVDRAGQHVEHEFALRGAAFAAGVLIEPGVRGVVL